ncbi:MAG: hypothetical protein JOZ81_20120, partial [Chloroflexi bacterium]|nr:hypothetical protein [Chloroflexota bacterium]
MRAVADGITPDTEAVASTSTALRPAARIAEYAPLVLAACAGVATAFFRLGARGLWGDEVWNVSWAQAQPLVQTFHRFLAPPDFPLEFVLVQISSSLGSSPF